MKKSFWRHFMLPKRRKKRPKPALVVYKPPKKHMTEPDFWKPPFTTKETSPLNMDKQNLVVVNEPQGLDLGKVTATVGVLLQAEMNPMFKLFIDDCLERFRNLDWGGVSEREGRMNDQRVMTRTGTIYGIYTELGSGLQIWVAADLDQGVTRIRLSDER